MAVFRKWSDNNTSCFNVGKRLHSVKEDEIFFRKIEKYLNNNDIFKKNILWDIENDWWTFYHFSELRKGIISWYPFKKNIKILEIGAECGALTGFLCEKAERVTSIESDSRKANIIYQRYRQLSNLEIINYEYEKLATLDLGFRYDYIIINRVFEFIEDITFFKSGKFLKMIVDKFLQKGGKIILIADNKYGIRNFCGGRDALTGKPFDAINNYPQGLGGATFCRNEFVSAIKNADILFYKFFYPLPDYRIPQLIYSDEYTKKNDIRDRIVFYEPNQETLLAMENNIYEDIVENNALPFLSNSFFIECCMEDILADIDYVTCSQDRGKEYSMVTSISGNQKVVKAALYDAGKETLFKSIANLNELEARKIGIVPYRIEEDKIIMPFIQRDTLSTYLVTAAERHKTDFWKALELWYQDILRSSNHVEDICNEEFRELSVSDRGIILQKAYLDMVPVNCFVEDNRFIYFDQEFTEKFVPAKYVFFRGIRYLYQSHKTIEKDIPLGEIKQRYNLVETWTFFESVEERFISRIRNVQEHKDFYKWTKFNRKEIYNRANQLDYQGEDIVSYTVTTSTMIQQQVQLDLLDRFTRICNENNLRFFLMYGSLLGAVRHKGFIPWDDDIDVAMPREDYDRLIEIADEVFSYPYFLQTPQNDKNTFYGGYAKLRNSETTGMEPRNWKHDCNQGIWIDVFPLDVCYESEEKNYRLWKKIHDCQQMLFAYVYDKKIAEWTSDAEEWQEWKKKALQYPQEYWVENLDGLLTECSEYSSPYLTINARYTSTKPTCFFAEDFLDYVIMEFEGLKVPVPIGYKRCLEIINGKRYMVYPKVEYRVPHHKGLFVKDVPYTKYLERFNVNFDIEEAVLLGESDVIEFFYNRYRKKIKQIIIIEELIEYKSSLVEIPSIGLMDVINDEDRNLIICAKKFIDYEKELYKHGIDDYKIFITNPQHMIQRK